MGNLLKSIIICFGLIVVLIGVGIVFFGPQSVGNLFAQLIAGISESSSIASGLSDPNSDSELRFYSVLFVAFGGYMLWIGLGIKERAHHVPIPCGIFFVGGLARILSIAQIGWPHPVFVGLMVVELVAPVLVLFVWFVAKRQLT